MSIDRYPIKATSFIINLLGDELIGSDSLAIFELVKNAYDADATKVSIHFNDLDTPNRHIIIEDNGCGMAPDIIQNVWLTIGTDYKKKTAKVSPKFKRTSLGNKGVGRLAVHRLADEITLESQAEGQLFGSKLHINWKNLVQSGKYIENLSVEIEDGITGLFPQGHGTRITLTGLKTKKWTKTILKDLAQKIENIKNPFHPIESFDIELLCNDPEKQKWLREAKNSTEILEKSLFHFKFSLIPDKNTPDEKVPFSWEYKFQPANFPPESGLRISNKNSGPDSYLLMKPEAFNDDDPSGQKEQHILKNSDLKLIGPISGVFHVFNQNGNIIDRTYGAGKRTAIKEYIKDNCGIKVFRDNIRVYNYGEPSDDWVGLEFAKVQRAGDHFSKKVTIGAVQLNLRESEKGLLEKTNREGFTDNETFRLLKNIIQEVFNYFERTAIPDRDTVEASLQNTPVIKRVGLSDTIKDLEAKLNQHGIYNEFSPLIKKVEKDYNDMRDVMLNSGMSGLNLGLIFHEVEREMRFLNTSLNDREVNVSDIRNRVKSLILLIENFSPVVKQNKKIKLCASKLIERAKQIHATRFQYHNIIFSSPVLNNEGEDFDIEGPGNLLLSSLSNILDNAIYWVSVKRELNNNTGTAAIYAGTDTESFDGPAILIADNGTGFQMETDDLIQPFRTLRPEGMGLGLYFVNLVMETIGGKLLFPDRNDFQIPSVYDGALVALVFPKPQK